MEPVEVFRSHDAAEVERAQRFLRNADIQSRRAGDAAGPLWLTVTADAADRARDLLAAADALSKPLVSAGKPEAEQPWWRQPGTIPMAIAAVVLLLLVDYRYLVMFAIVAVPLLGVRVYLSKRRGEDRFAGPSLSQDRPRPRHRDWRILGNGDDRR